LKPVSRRDAVKKTRGRKRYRRSDSPVASEEREKEGMLLGGKTPPPSLYERRATVSLKFWATRRALLPFCECGHKKEKKSSTGGSVKAATTILMCHIIGGK